jgi:hypothetical protein
MLFGIGSRRDGPIKDIASRYGASARIAGILVNRRKPDPIVTRNDRFSAVAMVRVEVPDRDPFAANRKSVMGGDRDRVQIAEPHRLRWSRMMAGRPHQRKSFSTAERQIDCTDRRSSSTSGVFFNSRIIGSISIKIDRLPKTLQKFS